MIDLPDGGAGPASNRVAAACRLRVDVVRLGLHPGTFRRPRPLAASGLTAGGTQKANRADARERLAESLARAEEREAWRVKTRPSRATKARRVDERKGRTDMKAGRGRVRID